MREEEEISRRTLSQIYGWAANQKIWRGDQSLQMQILSGLAYRPHTISDVARAHDLLRAVRQADPADQVGQTLPEGTL